MQAARLSASNIACRRGDRLLFTGLGFALGPGEALQLAGANGIGKSSLLRILAGIARPYAGSVEREGVVGLVDERLALDEHLPLGKALAFWSALDGEDEGERAADLGLSELLDVPVRYLSTGQRKRAALARLLGQKAAIWLLDEPLNGLDSSAAHLLTRLTAQHCASGGIAVVASHQTFALAGMQQLPLRDFVA